MKLDEAGQRLTWFWRRLRLMAVREVLFRIGRVSRVHLERVGFFQARRVPTPNLAALAANLPAGGPGVPPEIYRHAADAVLAGRLDIFALKDYHFGPVPQWNRDPKTNTLAPLSYGKTIDYRNPRVAGDIKYLWEPNRHLHLVTLAQGYLLSGDQAYLAGLGQQLASWFDQCPYGKGLNWSSSLELAIRLINWAYVWRWIGGVSSPLFQMPGGEALLIRWLESIYQHADFISGHLSRYSSANNHLIGEAAGLLVSAVTWPCWQRSRHWRDRSLALLVDQALMQNAPDGVNREQTAAYQHFVLDFLLIAALLGREAGLVFPVGYWQRMEAMLEYLASVMDVSGNVPMVGDADDGYVVRLSREPNFCPFRSLLATGAVLYCRPEFKAKAGRCDDKTRWLLGREAARHFDAIDDGDVHLPVRRAFPEGGYFILGRDFETPREIRLIVDAGPLGYQSIAAHGHADALAFTLSVGGREVLIDPGTYAYHTQAGWRNYFRGTAAHNTVRVDFDDQSVIGGNFMWLTKARATCEEWAPGRERDYFVGHHDGYLRLPDPVLHRRKISLEKERGRILVVDILECRGVHRIERFWHFSESCVVTAAGNRLQVTHAPIRVEMTASGGAGFVEVFRGVHSPPAGWVSRRFDVMAPCTTVVFRNEIKGRTELVSELVVVAC
jgi:hypothetical protein